MKTLSEWLAYCEQLHPQAIDMGLDRVKRVAAQMSLRIKVPVITVAGTNGKGSTCAMLEAIYLQAGYKTGVYTSAELFAKSFEYVEQARGEISLTYFEFSTLAILHMVSQAELDVVILEVGLGGRLDAVNIVDADCAIITSIDLDHTALLGNDREAIGFEKAGIMRPAKPVVVSDPVPPSSVLAFAEKLGADLWVMGKDFNFSGDQLQWSWAGRGRRYSGLAYPALRGANQLLNASGVLAALEVMRPQLPVTAQAIRNGFAMVALTGRFQIVPGEPVLVLDVAHNPHSVSALAANLDAMGFYPTTHAVFGAMADKDLSTMFQKMLPLVDQWYFADLPLPRASTSAQLAEFWGALNTRKDAKASSHESPQKALEAAIAAAAPTDRILVFGSFYTVGGVLQHGIPKLHAKHLSN